MGSFTINVSSGDLYVGGGEDVGAAVGQAAAGAAAAETRAATLREELDRERAPWVELAVRCVDEAGRGLEARSVVRVELDDVNDNAPHFEKARYVVDELAVRSEWEAGGGFERAYSTKYDFTKFFD